MQMLVFFSPASHYIPQLFPSLLLLCMSTGLGNISTVPYNCDWTSRKGQDRGDWAPSQILSGGTRHDNLQWRHDWTGHGKSRCGSLLSVPYGTPSPINATHSQWYCFLLETHTKQKNGAVIEIYRYIYRYNTFDMLQWMRELKPSFATLSTLWSARKTTNLIWQVSNWFLVINMIRLLFILLLPDFHWLYVFKWFY